MEFYRSDKIRWPIAVIFDPIELGPECTQSRMPMSDLYIRKEYMRRFSIGTRKIERWNSALVKGRLGAGMDIDVSD